MASQVTACDVAGVAVGVSTIRLGPGASGSGGPGCRASRSSDHQMSELSGRPWWSATARVLVPTRSAEAGMVKSRSPPTPSSKASVGVVGSTRCRTTSWPLT
ncbi:hypothetical protein [Nocardioides campestrisoli]|uniref:hypothetical protein n=1 Tax=Nocardioides campestrisoli TaxID=2736757 RepID=UPI00163D7EE9|nr:hypothetical protein [Nocardioides campestrisoli]